jgi:hypothetical protein
VEIKDLSGSVELVGLAGNGAAVITVDGNAVLENLKIADGAAGGVVVSSDGVLYVVNTVLTGNTGGAIINHGTATVETSEISGNIKYGIDNTGTLEVFNSLIVETTGTSSAGVRNSGDKGKVTLTNVTVAGKTTSPVKRSTYGLENLGTAEKFKIQNSIITGSTSTSWGDVKGNFTVLYSLIGSRGTTIEADPERPTQLIGGSVEDLIAEAYSYHKQDAAGNYLYYDNDPTTDDPVMVEVSAVYDPHTVAPVKSLIGTNAEKIDPKFLGTETTTTNGIIEYYELHPFLSPAISAGNNADAVGTVDAAGKERLVGQIEIGALESVGIIVTTLDDVVNFNFSLNDLSLREALYAAGFIEGKGGAVIKFKESLFSEAGQQVLNLSHTAGYGEFLLSNDVQIVGPEEGLIINAGVNGKSRIFNITNAAVVAISNLTLKNGYDANYGGAIYIAGADLTLENVIIETSKAGRGGGIYQTPSGNKATLKNVTFNNNEATIYGGGFYQTGGEVIFTNVTFDTNHAVSFGGGLYQSGGTSTITETTFTGNTAKSGAGAVFSGNAQTTITDSLFLENIASETTGYGGGIYLCDSAVVKTSDNNAATLFKGNEASRGGGIYQAGGKVELTDVTFETNNATIYGGGFYQTRGETIFTDVTFATNHATSYGGGLYQSGGTSTITGTIFTGNTTDVSGGGAMFTGNAQTTITDSRFLKNTASRGGGFLMTGDSEVKLEAPTFTDNTAGSGGNAVYRLSNSKLQLKKANDAVFAEIAVSSLDNVFFD